MNDTAQTAIVSDHQRRYWQKVGWAAHEFGLDPTSTDKEVLEHEKKLRRTAQKLKPNATWLHIYCAELRAGLSPKAPDYCEVDGGGEDENPFYALRLANMAAKIFLEQA